MKNKGIYLIIGVLILTGFFTTRPRTMDQETLQLIRQSRQMNSEELWAGFHSEKYPVDVYYGDTEYRYRDGKITEKEPSYPMPAFSISLEDFGPAVKAIPFRDARNIIDSGGMTREEREDVYISALLHEAFHCYQAELGADEGMEPGKAYDFTSDTQKDRDKYKALIFHIDEQEEYQKLCKKEMEALIRFYETGKGRDWLRAKDRRRQFEEEFLGADYEFFRKISHWTELIEGTAKQVELETLRSLNGQVPDFQPEFIRGDYRFYITGAIKSYIVAEWGDRNSIDFTRPGSLEQAVTELNTE